MFFQQNEKKEVEYWTVFPWGVSNKKMSLENYCAVHSSRCYLLAHCLQLGLGLLYLATRVCVVPLGIMAQREGTPVSIVHFTPFGRMILQISSCRDWGMSCDHVTCPNHNTMCIELGKCKDLNNKNLTENFGSCQKQIAYPVPKQEPRRLFFSPFLVSWSLDFGISGISFSLINGEESRTLCWFSSLFLHWKGWIYTPEMSWVVRPGIFRMVGRRSRILLGFSQFWVCLNWWTLL